MGATESQALVHAAVASAGGKYAVPPADRDKLALLEDGTLLIASSYATDMAVLAFIELLRKERVQFRRQLGTVADVQARYAAASRSPQGTTPASTKGAPRDAATHRQRDVVELIARAVRMRASDIHFRNFAQTTEVWMRIDGDMRRIDELRSEDGRELCSTIYQSMCDVADPTYKPGLPQDARLKRDFVAGVGLHGARIATRPLEYGNLFVMRLLARRATQSLEALGYQPEQVKLLTRMTQRTTGVNIFSGPTGSGKSTSLVALLSTVMDRLQHRVHLLTVENPPETPIQGAVQTPLIADQSDPESVANAWVGSITNALRLDPDIIMVGEMRDRLSAATAIDAAMTGHGVWTTLHANHAFQILDRLIEMGVSPERVRDASLMTGLINQSLVVKNCPRCSRPYRSAYQEVDPDLAERIERLCTPETVMLRGADPTCSTCGGQGYLEQTVAAECVVPTQRLMNEHRASGSAGARAYWVASGGLTKCAALRRLVNTGLVDPAIGEQRVCSLDEDEITLA